MIHVEPAPEPEDFDERVRRPGRGQAPGKSLKPLWRQCLPQLWEAYGGICAYVVIYIPKAVGSPSVDHFVPKSTSRDLAFEWSNYRLACSLMNSRKARTSDVLDPFEVEDGWFVLEPSSLEVLPAPDLPAEVATRVESTIARLRLNDPDCRQARSEHYDLFLRDEIRWSVVCKYNPFVARELVRQGIVAADGARE